MSKIHLNQSVNYLLMAEKKLEWINFKNPKAFIDYSQTIDDYENLEDYNLTKKRRALIVFGDVISDMEFYNKLSPIVTELFLRGRKLNVSLVFITQSYFKVPKTKTKCNTLFYHENS